MDSYEILGLPRNASKKRIRETYLQLVKKFHPDANMNLSEQERNKKEEQFKIIQAAYDNIMNERTISSSSTKVQTRDDIVREDDIVDGIDLIVRITLLKKVKEYIHQRRVDRIYKILLSLNLSLPEQELIQESVRIYLNINKALRENGFNEFNDSDAFDRLLNLYLEIYKPTIISRAKSKVKGYSAII